MYEYEEVRIKMDLIQKNLLEQVAGTAKKTAEIQLQILIL